MPLLSDTSNNPRLTAVLGPSRSGKTHWCLERFIASKGAGILLVPSQPYADRLESRIRDLDKSVPCNNVKTFGKMLREVADCTLLNTAHRTCQRLALAEIVETQVAGEHFFGKMRGTPGFAGALGESLRDLKLSGVTPEMLLSGVDDAARRLDDPAFARKATEIGRLYSAYQQFLESHGLCDEEDLPGHAARQIASGVEHGIDWKKTPIVLVDGFYRFSRMWRGVLAAIAGRGVSVAVTLPYDELRPLLFASPMRTLESLEAEFAVTRVLLNRPASSPASTLNRLEHGLFTPSGPGPSATLDKIQEDPGGYAVQIFDAPNPYTEVEMVVRALCREQRTNGTPWSRCAIIVRSAGEYADLIRSVGEAYGVTISAGQGRPLAEHPCIKTLLTLFSVFLSDWRREDVIGFLKSSYTPASKLAADSLRLRARRRALRQGREGWRKLAEEALEKGEALAEILSSMLESDRRLISEKHAPNEMTNAIEECVKAVGLARPKDEESAAALGQWNETLKQVALVARLTGAGQISFAEFHKDLLAALRSTPFSPPLNVVNAKGEAVTLIEPYDAGQLDARFVIVMGLTERVFPRRVNEDPFFRDEERDALRGLGEIDLEKQSDRADDERLLFYMAVTAAKERLILSFPRSSEESDTLPSFYLDEARALFEHIPLEIRTLADVAPRPEECVSDRDRLLAECLALSGDDVLSDDGAATAEFRAVLASRLLPRLPELTEALRQAYASPRRYSITEVETYNTCPFRHLMKYGLKLRALSDGAGAADKGTLLHAVMRRTFRRRRDSLRIDAGDEVQNLTTALTGELSECMQARAIDASPHRRRMMLRSLTDTLRELAGREIRYAGLFGASPSYFELSFGQEPDDESDDEEIAQGEERDYDSHSTQEPLMIPGNEGESAIQLCGAIDRVDMLPDDRRAIILDYKLGSSVEWDRIKQGRSLQVPLYMMAVEQLWGKVGAVACYESPRDRGRRRFYRRSEVDIRVFQPVAGVEDGKMAKPLSADEYMEASFAAQQSVRQAVAGIRAGYVMPTPGEHCRFCDYADVCRMARDGVHDGQPYDATGPREDA